MLIGELAKRTGFSKDTIRFYEKIGLIELPRKARRSNNYKEYPEALLGRLQAIRSLKGFGFSLSEIREILHFYSWDLLSCEEGGEKIAEKIRLIDQKILQLTEVRKKLCQIMESCETNDCLLVHTLEHHLPK
ncbi:MAG: MerR family transcriptional regulator [Bacteroidetes bacterium]|nr:MAG: MerR family transcriptional regulator [Bacteroidota bacterium]